MNDGTPRSQSQRARLNRAEATSDAGSPNVSSRRNANRATSTGPQSIASLIHQKNSAAVGE